MNKYVVYLTYRCKYCDTELKTAHCVHCEISKYVTKQYLTQFYVKMLNQ